MSRISLWHVAAAFTAVVAVVSFLTGYLDSRNDVPEPRTLDSGAIVERQQGTVLDIGDVVRVQQENGSVVEIPRDQIVLQARTSPATRSAIQPGDLVVTGVELDDFGGRAIRAIVVVDSALQDAGNAP